MKQKIENKQNLFKKKLKNLASQYRFSSQRSLQSVKFHLLHIGSASDLLFHWFYQTSNYFALPRFGCFILDDVIGIAVVPLAFGLLVIHRHVRFQFQLKTVPTLSKRTASRIIIVVNLIPKCSTILSYASSFLIKSIIWSVPTTVES